MDKPQRKKLRLTNYDYSQNGFYFITICSHDNKQILGHIEEGKMILNNYAEKLEKMLQEVVSKKQNILLDKYTFMPNHIHMVIVIENDFEGNNDRVGIFEFIKEFKSNATRIYIAGVKEGTYKPFDKKLWQRSYYDHVIKSQEAYELIWDYIDNNPLKWALDKYYYDNSEV